MKVYFHFSLDGFSNSYIVSNEEAGEAIIIDPGKMTAEILNNIENNKLKLTSILITHSHPSHCRGIPTLMKIYKPRIYAADADIIDETTLPGVDMTILKGDGVLKIAGLNVGYFAVPGHSSDSVTYKIGRILFTGDSITAGMIGSTNNTYSLQTLKFQVQSKILSQEDDLFLMPGHGPPSTIGAEKKYNKSFMDRNFIYGNN